MRSVSAVFLTSLLALGGCGGSTAPNTPGSGGTPAAAGVATTIAIYTGNNQYGTKGSALSDPLCTIVYNQYGGLMVGVVVNYTVATGGGQLQPPTSVQTAPGNGIATSGTWTLGPAAGAQTVTASTAGVAASVTFTATAQ
jgi:hypothetical protein